MVTDVTDDTTAPAVSLAPAMQTATAGQPGPEATPAEAGPGGVRPAVPHETMLAAAGLGLFLAVFAWPGAPGLDRSLPLACPLIGLASAAALAHRRPWSAVAVQVPLLLCFGALFPLVAVNLGTTYGFSPGPGARVGGVPLDAPVAWCAFVLLAGAVSDRLRWHGAAPRALRVRPAVATGLVLAVLESVWDPALLSGGLLWSTTPSWAAWPLGYTPGWPLIHFLIGYVWQDLFDTWDDLSANGWRRAAVALVLLTAPTLVYALSAGLAPAPPAGIPGPVAAAADLGINLLWTMALAWLYGKAAVLARCAAPRVLLTTATAPFAPHDGDEDILDYYSSRFTRGQGPFVTESESVYLASHLLARNLRAPARVLDSPTLEELETELARHPYEVVGIGFMNIARPKVLAMCRLIRRVSPRTRIVLGGYGVVCLDHELPGDQPLDGLYDHVCRDEGIGYMRRLLGEDPEAPVNPTLTLQRVFPLGMRFMPQTMMAVAAGFGCAKRCGFCATSAFFQGKHVPVGSAAAIARAVRDAFRSRPDMAAVPIFDEDWLADMERAREVGRLLEDAPELPAGAAPLSVFATASALARVSPAELVRMRIGYVWLGVESKFATLGKLRGLDLGRLMADLYDHGISVTASFVLGLDTQTPENLDEDLEWFAGLEPTTAQVSLMGPIPGTPLWERARAEGRLVTTRWEDQHLYHEVMRYRHLPPGMAHEAMVRAYDLLYQRHGPSVLRMWRVWLRAHLNLRGSCDPALAARATDLARLLALARPAIVAVARLGPNDHVRRLAAEALALHDSGVASPGIGQRLLGTAATAWVALRSARLALAGKPVRQPAFRRYNYAGQMG